MTYYPSTDPDAKQMQCECDHPDCNDCYPRPVQHSTGEVRKPLGVAPIEYQNLFNASWQDDMGDWYGGIISKTKQEALKIAQEAQNEGCLNCGVDQYIPGEGWKRIITLEDLQEAIVSGDVITDISELGMTAKELADKIAPDVDAALQSCLRFEVLNTTNLLLKIQEVLEKVSK